MKTINNELPLCKPCPGRSGLIVTINHICGHTSTKEYPQSEFDMIDWGDLSFEESQPCPTCQIAINDAEIEAAHDFDVKGINTEL